MSAHWNGNLQNTTVDIVIDTLAILFTIGAYIPQITRLHDTTSWRGISPYYILFRVLFSNAQFSWTLLMAGFAWPVSGQRAVLQQIASGRLSGWTAFGGILGLLQVLGQWLCEVLLLATLSTTSTRSDGARSNGVIFIIASIHTAIVVLPAIWQTVPKPLVNRSWGLDIPTALISMSNQVVAPFSLVMAFLAQILEMRRQEGNPRALSLLSLFLQVLAISFLSIRWFLRLGRLPWRWNSDEVLLWYQWAFPEANYLISALLGGLLLVFYF